MKEFKLGRLKINEHHEDDFPAELLSLTVGEVLDRLGAVDTEDNAEYEVIEAALKAVAATLLAKAQPEDIEGDIEMDIDFGEADIDEPEFPTYSDMLTPPPSSSNVYNGIEDFKF